MRKLLTVLLVILVLMSFSHGAKALNGYVALDYNLMHKGGNIPGRGGRGKMITDLMAFNLKGDVIPAGVPSAQTYDLEISYKVTDDITITLIEGCKHYFSQSGYSKYNDESYIKLRTKYEF